MTRGANLLGTVEAIHAAGLDAGRWDDALAAVMAFTGCTAASLESYDFGQRRLTSWRGVGNEPELIEEYRAYHGGDNPWAPGRPAPRAGGRFAEAHVFDLSGQAREPFYAGFVTHTHPRHFAAGLLDGGHGPQTVFTVTREPGCGEIEFARVRRFRHLLPHVRLALRVGRRTEAAQRQARRMAGMLDWIAEGAALLARDGSVLHANAALVGIARAGDGLSLGRAGLRLASPEARDRLARALSAAVAVGEGEGPPPEPFAAPRPSGAPAYVLTLRPLFPDESEGEPEAAAAVVFVRDPAAGPAAVLAPAWGLTPAEARLAEALRAGTAPSAYARRTGLSINTVYTHLRRLKEKVGARRLPELIHRLEEAAAPALRA